jgi:NadR type nicotinamide-nucleotide adenylyltransferase
VTVDAARELMPISGTQLREDLYRYRAFVDPLVYRSLIQKVVFVGTESTGKSTLVKALAEEMHTMHTNEYGRTLWEQHTRQGTKPSFHDLWVIAKTQYEQEQAAMLHSNEYLFCDTNPWTTMLWSEMYYGTADARLYELVERTKDEYKWFVCSNEFGWVDDGSRELGNGKAEEFHQINLQRLLELGVPYRIITGSVEQRVQQVKDDLGITIKETASV